MLKLSPRLFRLSPDVLEGIGLTASPLTVLIQGRRQIPRGEGNIGMIPLKRLNIGMIPTKTPTHLRALHH